MQYMRNINRPIRRSIRTALLFSFAWIWALSPGDPIQYNGWNVGDSANPVTRYDARDGTLAADLAPGALWIVSPTKPIRPATRSELEAEGWRVIAFVPRDGFLVQAVDADRARTAMDARKQAYRLAIPLRAEWKIDTALQVFGETSLVSSIQSDEEIPLVIFTTGPTGALEPLIEKAGGWVASRTLGPGKPRLGVRVAARHFRSFLQSVSSSPDVYSIEPGSAARLMNDNASAIVQTGSPSGDRALWHRGLHGEGQTIAILDTGLDYDSCYFSEDDTSPPPLAFGTEVGVPDPTRRKIVLYDFLYAGDFAAGAEDFDNEGHGTRVAGNCGGSFRGTPFGETVKNGVAPAAQIIMQDGGFAGADNCSDLAALACPLVDLTPFLNQAIAQGANFHNDSWGDRENSFPQNTYTAPTADMDDATWRHPEFLICCAAGNAGSHGLDSVGSPSVGKNVLSVGATQSPSAGGNPERLAAFSSLGWASDGRIKPDLTAPGQTFSAVSDGDVTTSNCAAALIQGTSMASPVTAACAAIVRQYFTEGWYPSGGKTAADAFVPSAALIKAALLNGAVDMTLTSTPPPNRYEGWGRVHLENSLHFDGDARRILVVDSRDAFTTASLEPFVYRFVATGDAAAGLLKVTLVWTDPPADPAATIALVNDLDLTVTDTATSTTYLGNHFDFTASNDGLTDTGGTADRINNVEMVIRPSSSRATFEVRITPSQIVVSPQGFALVIGGAVITEAEAVESRQGWMLY